jgi:hypothetical protein
MSIRIEHRLGIPAPASAIWEVLADLPGWTHWNPVYPRAEGSLRIGGRLSVTERAGGQENVLQPAIIDWVPEEQILWRVASHGGLARRLRFIEIEKVGEENSIFSNGEIWDGLFVPYVAGAHRRALRTAYTEMSEALSRETLKRWPAA